MRNNPNTEPEVDAAFPDTGSDGVGVPPPPGVDGSNGAFGGYDGPKVEISEEMRVSYMGYAMSTIVSRALPDVRDGLKPVQRRILYAMRELGLSPNSRHLKSAKIVGECFVAGTPVSTPHGLRPIEDLEIGDEVYTQGGVRRVTQAYVLPPQPLLRVELADGRFVTCTPGQQFKVLSPELSLEWRKADELQVGTLVVCRLLDNGINGKLDSNVEFLPVWREQGVTFHEVRRIVPAPAEVTYDIQVEEDHEFIANGMLVHNCIGNYHPHGDQAVYLTMVRMAQPFSLRYPLVDGQGNFGSIDDDPPAAYRYTEARLTPLAMELMEDIEKDTVDFGPTFDNERREPLILPGKFPNLICNGGSGIAVGMATNLPPHNLTEVCDAALYLLEHPDASLEKLMEYIPGPDFPTHGMILGTRGIKSAYETGRGSITMQGKTSIEPMDGGKSAIIITELPYQVIKSKLYDQIQSIAREKKVDGITNVADYSDKTGMRLVVELRRDVMPQKVLNYLLKHTPLRTNFGVILLSLVENGRAPRTLSLREMLQEYIDHRRIILTRRTSFELARYKNRGHILEGYQVAVQNLDEVIQIIRTSASTDIARSRLVERFLFSGVQAEAILNMQLRQLTGLEQDKIESEYKDVLKEIARLEDILSDPKRLDALLKADLRYLKSKFGDDRRTRIIPAEAEEIAIEDLIADEEMLITITRDGYVKRMNMDTFPTQRRGGQGRTAGRTKEEDNFEHLFRVSTHDYILFFTDRGRVYRLKAYDVPETSRQAMGTAIINLIQIQSDERITATVPIRDLRSATGYLLMVTEMGEIKRTKMEEYANLRANGLITFDLEEGDKLGWVRHTTGDNHIILTSREGMAIQFHEDDVPSRGRPAGGVRGMTLDLENGDRIVTADLVPEKSELLVVAENGLGKRTPMSEYRIQSRGGKGIKTMDITDRTGKLVASVVLDSARIDDLRLVIVTQNGVVIRLKVSEVRQTSTRSAQGVKLIELGEGDHVKTVEYLDVAEKKPDEE
ncbi:MAG: DNA gyrase subunit A [Armatimonadaceae bacterium]